MMGPPVNSFDSWAIPRDRAAKFNPNCIELWIVSISRKISLTGYTKLPLNVENKSKALESI